MAIDRSHDEDMTFEDTQLNKYLTFTVDRETYGIAIQFVTEIIGIQRITEVPDLPQHVRGIINLRGKVIPVMDMRLRFRREEKAYTERTCIVVIQVENIAIGLIVDAVNEVLDIPAEQIVDPPDTRTGFHNRFVEGIGKVGDEVKLLLDCNELLSEEELEALQ